MDSTKPAPLVQPKPGIRKRYLFGAAFIVIALVGCYGVASVFRLRSDTRALRDVALESIDGTCEKKIALHVGGLTTALARAASSFFAIPPEARAALEAVRRADVGVYKVQRHQSPAVRAKTLAAADQAMATRGWTRVVGVIEKKDLIAVYLPSGSFSSERMKCCVLVLDNRNLVIASAQGNAEPLLELARARLDLERAGRKCGRLIKTAAD